MVTSHSDSGSERIARDDIPEITEPSEEEEDRKAEEVNLIDRDVSTPYVDDEGNRVAEVEPPAAESLPVSEDASPPEQTAMEELKVVEAPEEEDSKSNLKRAAPIEIEEEPSPKRQKSEETSESPLEIKSQLTVEHKKDDDDDDDEEEEEEEEEGTGEEEGEEGEGLSPSELESLFQAVTDQTEHQTTIRGLKTTLQEFIRLVADLVIKFRRFMGIRDNFFAGIAVPVSPPITNAKRQTGKATSGRRSTRGTPTRPHSVIERFKKLEDQLKTRNSFKAVKEVVNNIITVVGEEFVLLAVESDNKRTADGLPPVQMKSKKKVPETKPPKRPSRQKRSGLIIRRAASSDEDEAPRSPRRATPKRRAVPEVKPASTDAGLEQDEEYYYYEEVDAPVASSANDESAGSAADKKTEGYESTRTSSATDESDDDETYAVAKKRTKNRPKRIAKGKLPRR